MDRMRVDSVFLPIAIIVALCALVVFPAHTAYAQDSENPKLEMNNVSDIVGKRICMLTGVTFDKLLMEKYEGVSQDDISYYNSNAELIGAVQAGKADAMVTDLPVAQLAVNRNEGIGLIPEPIVEDHYAFVLTKDNPLTD